MFAEIELFTWEDFLEAKQNLGLDDEPPWLMMCGVAGDNATRYLFEKRITFTCPNDENVFNFVSTKKMVAGDFVWDGSSIRTGQGGGHPALAGSGSVYCAGRLEEGGWFFFHSGHYHPKRIHALFFMTDFIENSCRGLMGMARDEKVNKLCEINLRLYLDNSDEITYDTTFKTIAEGAATKVLHEPIVIEKHRSGFPKSSPMTIGKSMPISITKTPPIPIGKPVPTVRPITIQPVKIIRVPEHEVDTDLGINSYGRHQLQVRIEGAPPWIDDSARTKCGLCGTQFGTLTRKHHCRRCGDIFCDKCSSKKKAVKHPAVKSGDKAKQGAVRVCNTCYNTQDLI